MTHAGTFAVDAESVARGSLAARPAELLGGIGDTDHASSRAYCTMFDAARGRRATQRPGVANPPCTKKPV
jgi:hypothetical protein